VERAARKAGAENARLDLDGWTSTTREKIEKDGRTWRYQGTFPTIVKNLNFTVVEKNMSHPLSEIGR
jgi:hypothetical protein